MNPPKYNDYTHKSNVGNFFNISLTVQGSQNEYDTLGIQKYNDSN